ncbi:probable inactive tRNA-specific adenosine deaminase-like protein 3 [Anthonomus grandis grandis]|uniref:probable inactive tRNA-specific adenosine deaminase-like protein 3 n=1 Tax=Anthonomus grandis grandis TaxID=2921223 RepID=UPI0021666117|nr:probable inactive tRNA-specific adenosine deaminase-like protein 3 [Anthonomus grandis grandis]
MSEPKKMKLEEPQKALLYPVLPDELTEDTPLVSVYVDTIKEPKMTSKVVLSLNSLLPVPELTHLKRINKREVLLFPVSKEIAENCLEVHNYLERKGFDTNLVANKIRTVLVAKIPPKTKKQHCKVHALWPCNFHPDKYLEKLSTNTLFNDRELDEHITYMRIAIEVAKKANSVGLSQTQQGVIVIDPKIKSVVAIGYSESTHNPCKHAAMVAIDNVSKTQNGGAWNDYTLDTSSSDLNLNGFHPKLLSHLQKLFSKTHFGATVFRPKDQLTDPGDGPYLCTSYHVYSTFEVCVMCAMALVHSRVKRVFYGASSDNGGLGTLCKIHTVRDLNHHYEVFGGLCESECEELNGGGC